MNFRRVSLMMGLSILLVISGWSLACGPGLVGPEGSQEGSSDGNKDGGQGDKAACQKSCSEGAKECTKEGVRVCGKQADGCAAWSAATACPTGQTCTAGDCVKSCTNQCSEGTKQCGKGGVQVCELQDDGCADWSASQACGAGELCNGGQCVKNCSNLCSTGAKSCDGDSVQTCEEQKSGCTNWSKSEPCPAGETCSGGQCTKNCTDQCTPATRLCSGKGVQTCEKQANGCHDWSQGTPCPAGKVCNGGNCVENCANQCALDALQCSGTGVQKCEKQASGCLDWGNVTPCPSAQVCSGGKCTKNCTDQCKESDKRCDGVNVQLCTKQTSGCTEWVTSKTCVANEACDKTSYLCVKTCTNKCNENATKCDSKDVQTCEKQANGCTDWSTAKACPTYQACQNDKCAKTCTDKCTPNATQCTGQQVQDCTLQVNGCHDWSAAKACPTGETCQGSACKKGCVHACIPGQKTCQGNQELTCVLVSKCWAWGNAKACPATTTCHMDVCAKGAETISANIEMCGTHVYTGTLTIQGGAKVTCKSGDLTIHAKRIFIDPSSSIDLSATSNAPSGATFRTCSAGTCGTSRGRAGAGGGGNGTKGSSATNVEYKYRSGNFGSCSCGTCRGGTGGGIRNSGYDQFVSPGGAGGGGCKTINSFGTICRPADLLKGGAGGGVIRLFADEKLTLYGKLLANGAAGLGGSAGAGGGAGGSVIVSAPEIDFTGAINAQGGGGGGAPRFSASCFTSNRDPSGAAGGKGRIKILHSDVFKNTGTLTGAVSSLSWLPPQGLSSSTHPEQVLHYNDTFQDFKIAWKKPYQSAKGYWYALDRSASFQLTPTNGTYTTATQVTLPASSFGTGGTWYFYILTVHSNATASTIANRWTVHINNKSHKLTSSSHPSQTTWYSGTQTPALSIAWAPPSGAPARSFRGFWYKVDRNSNTAPGRAAAGWQFTTDTQALVTQDAQGSPLNKWAYYFHLVAEDATGQLTKVAAHYRVQLGAEPSKVNFFGYVKDSSGNALNGATLALQPYGLTATTDTNGYYIFQNIYAGVYQISTKNSGFQDITSQVDIKAASSPNNITMTP